MRSPPEMLEAFHIQFLKKEDGTVGANKNTIKIIAQLLICI